MWASVLKLRHLASRSLSGSSCQGSDAAMVPQSFKNEGRSELETPSGLQPLQTALAAIGRLMPLRWFAAVR